MTDENQATTEIAPPPAEPAVEEREEKKSTRAAVVGKTITFVNFFLSLVFLATAFFFYANRLDLQERKGALLKKTGDLTKIEADRKKVVDDYDVWIKNESSLLENETKSAVKDIQEREIALNSIQDSIAKQKSTQDELIAESRTLQQEQETLIGQISGVEKDGQEPSIGLRERCENELSESEALDLDKVLLLDRIAKTQIELRSAKDRNDQLEETISEMQRASGGR